MNIAFFLLPKIDVVCLTPQFTLRQTLEKMEHHRFTAVPILNENGNYLGTVTEGDLLWFFKNNEDLSFENAHRHSLAELSLQLSYKSVRIDAKMEDLIRLAKVQNFVPVVDDMDKFIGIVRRSDIIEYCAEHMF
jgi:CBS domain-containing protein